MALSIAERHNQIISKLKSEGFVNVNELSKELKVSAVTIRKDLKLLEERNLLFRTHGSAAPQNPYIADRHVSEKEKIMVEEKRKIAQKAVSMLEPHDSIILASGTTINEFSRQIQPLEGLTLICASLTASQNLTLTGNFDILQLGGLVRKTSSSVVGPLAEKMLEGFSCSKLFLGADGIDPDYGITTTNAMEASLNQCMIKAAQKIIVLADGSKFGRRGFGKICPTEHIDTIITDTKAPDQIVAKLREKGIEVWQV